eukprot:7564289-Pyramimonas_sp.AAC.1
MEVPQSTPNVSTRHANSATKPFSGTCLLGAPWIHIFSYAPLRGSRAQRRLMRTPVRDFSGRFAGDIL